MSCLRGLNHQLQGLGVHASGGLLGIWISPSLCSWGSQGPEAGSSPGCLCRQVDLGCVLCTETLPEPWWLGCGWRVSVIKGLAGCLSQSALRPSKPQSGAQDLAAWCQFPGVSEETWRPRVVRPEKPHCGCLPPSNRLFWDQDPPCTSWRKEKVYFSMSCGCGRCGGETKRGVTKPLAVWLRVLCLNGVVGWGAARRLACGKKGGEAGGPRGRGEGWM